MNDAAESSSNVRLDEVDGAEADHARGDVSVALPEASSFTPSVLVVCVASPWTRVIGRAANFLDPLQAHVEAAAASSFLTFSLISF